MNTTGLVWKKHCAFELARELTQEREMNIFYLRGELTQEQEMDIFYLRG